MAEGAHHELFADIASEYYRDTLTRIYTDYYYQMSPFSISIVEGYPENGYPFGNEQIYGKELADACRSLGLRLNPRLERRLLEIENNYEEGFLRASAHLCGYALFEPNHPKRYEILYDAFLYRIQQELYKNIFSQSLSEDTVSLNLMDPPNLPTFGEIDYLLTHAPEMQREGNRYLLRMLRTMFASETDPGIPNFNGSPLMYVGACDNAERGFRKLLPGDPEWGDIDWLENHGIIVVHVDDQNNPVFLEKRKGFGDAHSGLSLCETSVNGVWMPPGTIMGISSPDFSTSTLSKKYGDIVLASSNIRHIGTLTPRRISTFAIGDLDDRVAAFRKFRRTYNTDAGYSIDTFRDGAIQILSVIQ